MFVNWILFPLLFGATLVGLGLGVRRLSVPFSSALLLPVGYCVALIIAAIFTWSGATTNFAGPITILIAAAGYFFAFKPLRASIAEGALKRQLPWIGAGFVGFILYGLAILVSGKPTYSGYNQIVDIPIQMGWAQYLSDHGRDQVEGISSMLNAVNSTLFTGYPGGPQALLGSFSKTFGMDISRVWEPYHAIMAGSVILGAYALLRLITTNRWFAAIGAFAVGQASPMMGYAHIGGIKELTAVVTILATGALIPTAAAPEETKAWKAALPFTVGLAGAFSVFSLTILPWLGIFAAGAALIIWKTVSLRAALVRGGLAIVAFLIVTLPTSYPSKDSMSFAKLMEKELGNLANPVSPWSATGVWITPDHRFKLEGAWFTVSVVIGVIVILLALLGLWHAARKKQPTLIIVWVGSLIGLCILLARMGQWVDFKGMVLMAPVSLTLAITGLAALIATGRKPLVWGGWGALAALLLVLVYSDGLRYGSTQLAPFDRLAELREYNKKYAGTKATLMPDWDENGQWQMRDTLAAQAFNYPFVMADGRINGSEQPEFYRYDWDLDQLSPPFVNGYDLIVLRRSPGQSRPGRAFKLVDQGKYFNVWQRTSEAPTVAHVPMSGLPNPEEKKQCQDFLKEQPKGTTATIAPGLGTAPTAVFDPVSTSSALTVAPENPSAVYTNGRSGRANGAIEVPTAGNYDVYAIDLSHRTTTVTVGEKSFEVAVDPSAALRPQYLGDMSVPAGTSEVKVDFGGQSIQAGTGQKFNSGAWLGSLQLIPKDGLHPDLVTGPVDKLQCPDSIDWIETP